MSDIIKYTFWGHLRVNVIYYMLVAVTAIFNMRVCLHSCPMCRLRLTLDFIAALISCVETLWSTKCSRSSSWYHVLPNAAALFFHFNVFGHNPCSLYGQPCPPPPLSVIINQPQEMMNNMPVVSILPFLLHSFKNCLAVSL